MLIRQCVWGLMPEHPVVRHSCVVSLSLLPFQRRRWLPLSSGSVFRTLFTSDRSFRVSSVASSTGAPDQATRSGYRERCARRIKPGVPVLQASPDHVRTDGDCPETMNLPEQPTHLRVPDRFRHCAEPLRGEGERISD